MSQPQLVILLVIIYLLYLLRPESYPSLPVPQTPVDPDQDWKRRLLLQQQKEEKAQAEAEQARELKVWSDIHYSFANPDLIKSWQLDGHNIITTRKWMEAGALPTEHALVSWISNVKSPSIEPWKNFPPYEFNNPEWVLHYFGNLEPLRSEYHQSKK